MHEATFWQQLLIEFKKNAPSRDKEKTWYQKNERIKIAESEKLKVI